MSQNVILACWGLAEELLSGGRVVESIRVLESLLQKVGFDRELLWEVETRLRLSQIYLKHTRNFQTCKEHLVRGVCIQSIVNLIVIILEFGIAIYH